MARPPVPPGTAASPAPAASAGTAASSGPSGRRVRSGWLLHGLGPDAQRSIEHAELAVDADFAAFCTARLTEELAAADRRRDRDPGSRQEAAGRHDEGTRVLRELLAQVARGALPDDVMLQLLLGAYAAHPDFRPHWRDPRLVLDPEPRTPSPRSSGSGS